MQLRASRHEDPEVSLTSLIDVVFFVTDLLHGKYHF